MHLPVIIGKNREPTSMTKSMGQCASESMVSHWTRRKQANADALEGMFTIKGGYC